MAPLVLQPFKIEVHQNKVEKVNAAQNSLSMEKVTSEEEKSKVVNNITNNNSNLADASPLTQITTKPVSSPTIITNGTNGSGVQSAKRLNFLNNSTKLERFVCQVNKFENHVNSLPKNTRCLATSMTMLEKEWKELQVFFVFVLLSIINES